MEHTYTKIQTMGTDVPLKVTAGHFATNHAHTNYYLDMTTIKARASEAHGIARVLAGLYLYDMVIDTIVCMEGTQVIGAFLTEELTKGGFLSTNQHKTIYVVGPEFNSNSQLIFRDNLVPMIQDKHVLILVANVTTGQTVSQVMESIQYYGGILQGVSAVFSAVDSVNGVPVISVFGKKDLPDYEAYDYRNCPMCRKGEKIRALVNSFGYSAL